MVAAATLSDDEIARAAYAAGFRGDALTKAIAVAIAESQGQPRAVGDTRLADAKWGPSVGLWQVRTLWAERGTGGPRDIAKLSDGVDDPLDQARAAFQISGGGTNWSPWSVSKSGADRQYLQRAAGAARGVWGPIPGLPGAGIPGLPGSAGGGAIGDAVGNAVGGVVGDVFEAARPYAIFVAALTVAGALVVAGMVKATNARQRLESAAGVAKTVATKGAA